MPDLPAKPIIDIDLTVADPTHEASYGPGLESIGLVHWLTEPDWYEHRLFKAAGRAACARPRLRPRLSRTGPVPDVPRLADGARGFGMRYNAAKEPIVREIYDRIFRAAGLL